MVMTGIVTSSGAGHEPPLEANNDRKAALDRDAFEFESTSASATRSTRDLRDVAWHDVRVTSEVPQGLVFGQTRPVGVRGHCQID
jgi:hypothetical protein